MSEDQVRALLSKTRELFASTHWMTGEYAEARETREGMKGQFCMVGGLRAIARGCTKFEIVGAEPLDEHLALDATLTAGNSDLAESDPAYAAYRASLVALLVALGDEYIRDEVDEWGMVSIEGRIIEWNDEQDEVAEILPVFDRALGTVPA